MMLNFLPIRKRLNDMSSLEQSKLAAILENDNAVAALAFHVRYRGVAAVFSCAQLLVEKE